MELDRNHEEQAMAQIESEPDVASLVGVISPVRKRASFVTPVFASGAEKWLQRLKAERVEGFERLKPTGDVSPVFGSENQIQVMKDSEPVYAFAFDQSDVVVAPRRELARILSGRLAEIQDDPLICLDVAEFIGDRGEIRSAVKASAAEISAVDPAVAYSFFCDQLGRSDRSDLEEAEKIRSFALLLLRFFRSYSRYLYVGSDAPRRKLRDRYQRALESLIPFIFDLELAQIIQERISGLEQESAQYVFDFGIRKRKLNKSRIRTLTRTGMSRATAIKLLERAMSGSLDKQTSDSNSMLGLARSAIFSADRALFEQASLSRTLKKAEKKIRKRQLSTGVLSIAYGVILLLRAGQRSMDGMFHETCDTQYLGLSAIAAGLRDLAPPEPLQFGTLTQVAPRIPMIAEMSFTAIAALQDVGLGSK
jgi:hypothetical protein